MASLPEDDLCCPVCCEIFKNPVVLSCSHSVCKECLQKFWRTKKTQECPVCRRLSSHDPPVNLALKNLCESFHQQKTVSVSSGSEEICSLHGEKLKLFCLDDKQPVCLVCRDSQQHNNHTFRPVSEVIATKKEKLNTALKSLKQKLKHSKNIKGEFEETVQHTKAQVDDTEREIKRQFEKLHQFLRDEEDATITALKEEEEQKKQMMKEKLEEMNTHISALSHTIRDTEEMLKDNDVCFLKKFPDSMERVQISRPDPQTPSGALIHVPRYLGNLTFRVWEKMRDIVHYEKDNVKPQPSSDNPERPDEMKSKVICSQRWKPLNPSDQNTQQISCEQSTSMEKRQKKQSEQKMGSFKKGGSSSASKKESTKTNSSLETTKSAVSAMFIFSEKQRPKLKQQRPDLSDAECTRMLARRWNELSDKKKETYKNLEMMVKTSQGQQSIAGDNLAQFKNDQVIAQKSIETKEELEIICLSSGSDNDDDDNVNAQKAMEKKATEDKNRYERKPSDMCSPASVVSPRKKMKFEGEPKKPPVSGYQNFCQEIFSSCELNHLPMKERMCEIGGRWQRLTQTEKEQQKSLAEDKQTRYKRLLDQWLESLSPLERAAYKVYNSQKRRSTTKPGGKHAKVKARDEASTSLIDEHDDDEISDDDDDEDDDDDDEEKKSNDDDDEEEEKKSDDFDDEISDDDDDDDEEKKSDDDDEISDDDDDDDEEKKSDDEDDDEEKKSDDDDEISDDDDDDDEEKKSDDDDEISDDDDDDDEEKKSDDDDDDDVIMNEDTEDDEENKSDSSCNTFSAFSSLGFD